MKRTLGILVATALLLSCLLSSTAFASDSCTLSVSVSAIENGKVTATVSIASNPGIASLAFSLKYDNTKLRSISATAGSTFSGALVNDETAPNEISYYWFSVSKLASTGSLMVVEFEIIEGDWTSTELVLSVADDGVTDGETTIPATVSNATVTKPAPAHTHTPGAEWLKSADKHWHACTGENCSEKLDIAKHTWKIKTEAGIKTFTCTICDYQKTEPVVDPTPNPNPDTPNTGSGVATGSGIDAESITSAPLPPVTGDQAGLLAIGLLAVSAGIIFFIKKAKKAR